MNSLARTLGSEEPTVVTLAVRPGVVDSQSRLFVTLHFHCSPQIALRHASHRTDACVRPSRHADGDS